MSICSQAPAQLSGLNLSLVSDLVHRRRTRGVRGAMAPHFLSTQSRRVMYYLIIIVLSCNCWTCWTKDTWFALAELAFSRVWLVVHSNYGPRGSRYIALYNALLRGVVGGVTSNFSRALIVNYSPPHSQFASDAHIASYVVHLVSRSQTLTRKAGESLVTLAY